MRKSASQPDQVAGLHGRASDWYGQHGYVADAYHHALLAGHHQRAAQIVEENAWAMVRHAELATLEKWIQALPGDAVAARPWLRIYHAWALMLQESEAAEGELKAVERHPQAGDGTALPAEMQGHISAIRAWIAYMRGDPERAAVLSRQALAVYPQMDAAVSSVLMTLVATGCVMQNDLPGGARAFAEALDLAQSSGNIMLEVLARTSLGSLNESMGHLHEAEASFQEALQIAIRGKSPAAATGICLPGTRPSRVESTWHLPSSLQRSTSSPAPCGGSWMRWHAAISLWRQYSRRRTMSLGRIRPWQKRAGSCASIPLRYAPWRGWERLGRGCGWRRASWMTPAAGPTSRGLSAEGKLDLGNEVEYLALVRILLAEQPRG